MQLAYGQTGVKIEMVIIAGLGIHLAVIFDNLNRLADHFVILYIKKVGQSTFVTAT